MIKHNGRTYFTENELKCKGSGKLILADGFADMLRELRIIYGKPMIVTSACRSTLHNKAVGGATNSKHICDNGIGCLAIDVSVPNGVERMLLGKIAIELGWSVGVPNKNFIHLDARCLLKEPQVLFGY